MTTATVGVIAEVMGERRRQDEKWGEQNHPSGTGAEQQLVGIPVPALRDQVRLENDTFLSGGGSITYANILLEEVLEAFAEEDPTALRAELIQVAAVTVAWVEALDRRAS